MLRELNVSIPEILTFLSNRSAENMEQLLREKITELNNTISNLKSIQQALVSRHQDMSIILKIDLSGICITEQKKSYLVTVPTTADASAETEIESIINKTKQYQLHRLHDAAYGSMISVESLYSGDFQNYSALYFELPNPASKKRIAYKTRREISAGFLQRKLGQAAGPIQRNPCLRSKARIIFDRIFL